MARLEDLTKGALVRGILGDRVVKVVDVTWHGSAAITLTFTDELTGRPRQELLYRDDEAAAEVEEAGRAWSIDADGELFRLASEALRIHLAHLFDPYLAVHTSNLEPLPHQIDAVYGEMLPRQPLRFLLADDPGAGKTIMAGLLIKELMLRGDVERCLIVAPGSLVEQWQDELWHKFGLEFEILTTRHDRGVAHAATRSLSSNLLIARLDQLVPQRGPAGEARATDWDLVVVDEAHKMSAHFFGDELREDEALPARRAARPSHPPPAADDGDAAQRARRRTSSSSWRCSTRTGSRASRERACTRSTPVGPDAPDGQGEAAHLRRQAAVPRAARLHRQRTRCPDARRCSTSRSPSTSARR